MSRSQLEELISQTKEALLNSGASSYHMNIYRAFTNKVRNYAEKEGIDKYTPELGLTVLRDFYGFKKAVYVYCMNELNDYLMFGSVNPYKGKQPRVYDIPDGFADSTSFLKPIFLISFHICSIGFSSGVYGGIKISSMFSGIFNEPDLCQAAPSQTNMILSRGNVFDNSFKNKFIQSVLQYGITTKQLSPVSGSTAPYAYLNSLI